MTSLDPLFDALPDGVVHVGLDGHARRWNRRAGELLDWPAQAVAVSRSLSDVGARRRLPQNVADVVEAALKHRHSEPVQVRLARPGAAAVTVAVTTCPVYEADGASTGVAVVLEDVTERLRLDQQRRQSERLAAMAQLAGGVAHDFNNLLTSIVGYSQLLLNDDQDDAARQEAVAAIARAGKSGSELTAQLAAFGRRQVVQPVAIDPSERVATLEPMLRRLVGEAVDVRVVTSPESQRVRLDPHEFDQVITNLVVNADEAMPDGGRLVIDSRPLVLLGQSTSTEIRPGSYVVVTIGDTGVGMTDEVRHRCFDPFFTTKPLGRAPGVGLSAVYGVVNQAGGHVEVTSRPGGGATFRLYLPTIDAKAWTDAEPVADPAPAARRRRRATILLVDDEPQIRQLGRAILEAQGHVVVDAGDAATALELAASAERPFDILVSDIVMPGEHGDVLATRMLGRYPELRVLLVSGYVDRTVALDPSRVSFLQKPFAPAELAEHVSALLPARRVLADRR